MSLSARRAASLAITPKVSSFLSICGSAWIITEVLFNQDRNGKRRHRVYCRLLMAMSIYDILVSTWFFASTWAVPTGTPNAYNAIGTQGTCITQGFFLQLGVGIPIYNVCLCLYYLLVIRYSLSEEVLRKWAEPCMHLGVALVAFGTASAAAHQDFYHFASLWCWIAPPPADAEDAGPIDAKNALAYRWIYYFGPIWFCIPLAIGIMMAVYLSVRRNEAKSMLYTRPEVAFRTASRAVGMNHSSVSDLLLGDSAHGSDGPRRSFVLAAAAAETEADAEDATFTEPVPDEEAMAMSTLVETVEAPRRTSKTKRQMANHLRSAFERWTLQREESKRQLRHSRDVFDQASWYMAAFIFTHMWAMMNRSIQLATGNTKSSFALSIIHVFVLPLQGFLNFLVYRRPVYMKHRRRKETRIRAAQLALTWTNFETTSIDAGGQRRNSEDLRAASRPSTRVLGGLKTASRLFAAVSTRSTALTACSGSSTSAATGQSTPDHEENSSAFVQSITAAAAPHCEPSALSMEGGDGDWLPPPLLVPDRVLSPCPSNSLGDESSSSVDDSFAGAEPHDAVSVLWV